MLGLICSVLSVITTFISAICITKKNIFIFQCFNKFFGFLYTILLNGYSGAIVNILSLIRNYLTLKNKMTRKIQFVICSLILIIGIYINNDGIIGFLPIFASIQYTIIACHKKSNVKNVKYSFLINVLLWAIYDFAIKSYPTGIANIIIAISCIETIINIQKKEIYKEKYL